MVKRKSFYLIFFNFSLLIEGTSLKKLCQGGQAISSLKLEEISTQLYGRSVLKFNGRPAGTPLPSHKLGIGEAHIEATVENDNNENL